MLRFQKYVKRRKYVYFVLQKYSVRMGCEVVLFLYSFILTVVLPSSLNLSIYYFTPELEFENLQRSPGIDSQPGGIDSLESVPRLLKRLQIRLW